MAVFGLKKIYLNQVENNYQNYEQETVSSYGYYAGGMVSYPGNYKSDCDRIDYANETVSLLSNFLSAPRGHHSTVQNGAEYGYVLGGFGGPTNANTSNLDKIDFTNEVISRSPTNFRVAMYGAYGVYSSEYGYYAGFAYPVTAYSSFIDRLDFSADTFSALGSNLPDSKRLTSGLHSSAYGYWFGGTPGAGTGRINFSDETVGSIPGLPSTTARTSALSGPAAIIYSGNGGTCSIDRFTFAGETNQTVANALRSSGSASEYVGSSESSDHGYFIGGGDPASSLIDRYDFSVDTNKVSNSKLTLARGRLSGGGGLNGGSKITRGKPQFNSIQRTFDLYGYFCGGNNSTDGGSSTATLMERVDFSTDTNVEIGSRMSYGQRELDSAYDKEFGFNVGGYDGSTVTGNTQVDRLDTTSETCSIVGNLPVGSRIGKSTQSPSYGFWDKGEVNSSTVMRFDFSTYSSDDAFNLPLAQRRTGSSFENQLYGYFCATNTTSNVQRIEFSNSNTSMISEKVFEAPLGGEGMGSQNAHFGYAMGGEVQTYPNTAVTKFDRMDFANETFVLIPTIHGPTGIKQGAAIQNHISSWYKNGSNMDNLNKLDFDTDTTYIQGLVVRKVGSNSGAVVGRSTLTQTNYNTVPESVSYGYYAGGTGSASTVERLDNATETFSSPTNKRQVTNNSIGNGAENSQYGYYFGGYSSSSTSTIEKLDFTSEVFGVSISNLTVSNNRTASAYTNDYAYVFGNYLPPITSPYTTKTSIDRFEYINETIDTSTRMNSESREGMMGTQSSYFGYAAGGSMNPPTLGVSRVDKLDFTTEIASVITDSLLYNKRLGATIQNKNFGYFGGGQTTPSIGNRSVVERIDFTTETISHPGNYDLPQSRQGLGGSENLQYGYFVGGYTSSEHSTVERLEFETETMSVPGNPTVSPMNTSSQGLNGGSGLRQVGKNNRNDSRAGLDNQGRNVGSSYGYSIGGSPNRYEVDRFDFLNETYFALNNSGSPAPFGQSSQGGAVSNKSFGYYTGHQVPSGPLDRSIVARLDFTNDSWVDTPTIMTYLSHRIGTTYNNNYGYIAGGEHPSATDYSFVNRLDFETESMNLLAATLSRGTERLNTGIMRDNTMSYGYFMGGYSTDSRVDRLDFNTESMAISTNLPQGQHFLSAYSYGKANLGYYVAGVYPSAVQSDIIRFDFTTETYTDTGNDSSLNLYGMNTTQNDNYGYGSMGGPGQDSTERIEFVTETASSPGATTSTSGSSGTGMSN